MARLFRLLIFPLMLALGGCNQAPEGQLSVDSAWARPSPQGAPAAAFYMTIANDSRQPDVLQQVRVDACDAVEIHRTTIDEEGVMRMAPVAAGQVPIPAGDRVVLEPGGLHVMCIGLAQPLLEGQGVPLILEFDGAGAVPVTAQIRQEAPQ